MCLLLLRSPLVSFSSVTSQALDLFCSSAQSCSEALCVHTGEYSLFSLQCPHLCMETWLWIYRVCCIGQIQIRNLALQLVGGWGEEQH